MPTDSHATREAVYSRRQTRFTGLFFDEFAENSAWIRDAGTLHFPPLPTLKSVTLKGEVRPNPDLQGRERGIPTLEIFLADRRVALISQTQGTWETPIPIPAELAASGFVIRLVLKGVSLTNFLAWLGRIGAAWPATGDLQKYRRQDKNRQIRILSAEADGELAFDFANRHAPYSTAFARRHANLGLNVVGYILADLGIGESARCMIRAADAAHLPTAAVPLKLPCKARLGDHSYASFIQDTNPHAVNVFHLDAPGGRDIDTHHGPAFRADRYNVGYWAWELPEFPDSWVPYFDYFDEIWCPSDFVRNAIADKSPLPVITMPHSISFYRPPASAADLRRKFNLPPDHFLFLFLYDLNSYTERKNPRAVLSAFQKSGLGERGASLVLKVHGVPGNEHDFAALQELTRAIPGLILLSQPFSRAEIYELQTACDCFVSLHRSEGFGLAIAECMFLGKPVIFTNWSAPAEYADTKNSCPVRYQLTTLEKNHGPYSRGQSWADPDISHAAEWMQALFGDRALAQQLGRNARATIEERFAPATIGARYRRRLEAIASW